MLTIVMPMGGDAKRFAEKGYTFPKPLVEIVGRPMVEIVVQNVAPSEAHGFVFICRQDHIERFALADVLRLVAPECRIVPITGQTAGALCSVLLAMEFVGQDDELLVANADQVIDATTDAFLNDARRRDADGAMVTFPSTHPKWSYARLEGDRVVAVAEKRPISVHATAGLYYFRRGGDFLAAAEAMILKNAALHNEFYVCPVYNELILAGKKVVVYPITREQMHSLGTPEDVERFAAGYLPGSDPSLRNALARIACADTANADAAGGRDTRQGLGSVNS